MRPGGRDRAFRLIDVPIHEQLLTADPIGNTVKAHETSGSAFAEASLQRVMEGHWNPFGRGSKTPSHF
jgi:hypothetical protein